MIIKEIFQLAILTFALLAYLGLVACTLIPLFVRLFSRNDTESDKADKGYSDVKKLEINVMAEEY